MNVSEILAADVLAWGRYDVPTAEDVRFAELALTASKAYISGLTGLDAKHMDNCEDLTIAVLTAAVDMLTNRTLGSVSNGLNRTIDDCISMHRINLL